jgi:hypothetical protein
MKTNICLFVCIIMLSACQQQRDVNNAFPPVYRWTKCSPLLWDSVKNVPDADKTIFLSTRIDRLIPILSGRVKLCIATAIQIDSAKVIDMETIKIDSVSFLFGSGSAINVDDGHGGRNTGIFNEEIIAKVYTDRGKTSLGNPIVIFVRTLNRAREIKGNLAFLETIRGRVTILPGESLAKHWPRLKVLAGVAGTFDIPIEDSTGKLVGPDRYLSYIGRYKSILFPYDVIDMDQEKVFDKDGHEVNFEERREKTELVNKERQELLAQIRRNQSLMRDTLKQ